MTKRKERPMIFTGESVRAIQDDKKIMTRRVMKEPWKISLPLTVRGDWPFQGTWAAPGVYEAHHNQYGAVSVKATTNGSMLGIKPAEFEWITPWGRVGDRLWVKETFTGGYGDVGQPAQGYVSYRADGEMMACYHETHFWRSPRFMPRWASRLLLEITAIKVERLQNISELDCERELGVALHSLGNDAYPKFRQLWDSINGKRKGCAFADNPFVAAITFKRIE